VVHFKGVLMVLLGVTPWSAACSMSVAGGVRVMCSKPMESAVWLMPPT
jgi:hypothetical protein